MTTHLIHEKACALAKVFLQTERELVAVLQEIDQKKIFIELGYSSLFAYCVQALGLSESQAGIFIGVARKCVEVPLLQKALDTGDLNVSKAKRILPVIDKQNCETWIEKAIELPQKELEQLVVERVPDAVAVQRIKPVSESLTRLISDVPHAVAQDIARVRELLMQERGRSVSLGEVQAAMAQLFLERRDPLRKAQRVLAKREEKTRKLGGSTEQGNSEVQAAEAAPAGKPGSQALPLGECVNRSPRFIAARVQHAVQVRDQGQCRHRNPDGSRCRNRIFLQKHHVHGVAQGGRGTEENIVLLCSNHHRFLHYREEATKTAPGTPHEDIFTESTHSPSGSAWWLRRGPSGGGIF